MVGTPGPSGSRRGQTRSPSSSPGLSGGKMSSAGSKSSRSTPEPDRLPRRIEVSPRSSATPPPGVSREMSIPEADQVLRNRGGSPLANIFRLDPNNPPTQISGRNMPGPSGQGRGRGATGGQPLGDGIPGPSGSQPEPQAGPPAGRGRGTATRGRGGRAGGGRGAAGRGGEQALDIGLTRDSRYYADSNNPVRMRLSDRGRGLGRFPGRAVTHSPSSTGSTTSSPAPQTPPGQMGKRPREGSTPPSGSAGPSKGKKRM